MDVRFRDELLALIETNQAARTGLPFGVLGTARKRLAVLRAAPDFATLLKWRSFGLSAGALLPGTESIRVAGEWEMLILFEQKGEPASVILSVSEIATKGRASR